ncbi:twin-arginine translocase TatA/TatE family subunit [Bacteroides ovatus]|uniref:Sec-independent protein translocase subunit TatA/TatB n=1 Tax=Bacteroides ovatus TaxID=28116 RepID=UPI0022AAF8C1|nr:twin-arginine translocase TatA/TatE family subunit [Bacteroides ovatus]MCZ2716430.1 twin-arginine translocase TatA/TatE family subunit [Bacteroides ovatus]
MCNLLLLGIGGQELIFIALVILLLFGGKKIPELMKGLGKRVKSFKDGMNGIDETVEETVSLENKKSNTEK